MIEWQDGWPYVSIGFNASARHLFRSNLLLPDYLFSKNSFVRFYEQKIKSRRLQR